MLTVPIEASDAASDFCCGEEAIDKYFRVRALTNHQGGLSTTWVLRCERGRAHILGMGRELPRQVPEVFGFYTLSAYSISRKDLPSKVRQGLPEPVPFTLLGRMGVDQRVQGYDLGRELVTDALWRTVDAASIVGSYGVLLDAMTERLVTLYETLGFARLDGLRMYLPMSRIRKAQQRP